MARITGFWESFDDTKLFYRYWPVEKPKAAIYLIHGLGEHSGRYEHVARFFNKKGFSCIAFDLRGHGKSGGKRGHARSYESVMKDVDVFCREAARLELATPAFLYGHSLGGNIVLNYVLRRNHDFLGVVSTSPWLKLTIPPPKLQVFVATILAFLVPGLVIKTNLDIYGLSRNKAVATEYMNDELVHGFISVRFFREILKAAKFAEERAGSFPLPLLLVHGTDDPITSHDATKEYANNSNNASLASWQSLFHETHNEDCWKDVLQYNTDWMESQLK